MDAPLRRAARSDPGAGLRARLRAGELSPDALELACRLGHAPAAEALGRAPDLYVSAADAWGPLCALGREACVRAVLALSEAAGLREAHEPYAREVSTKILGQIQDWLRDPSPRHQRALADLDADFLSWFAEGYWLGALLDSVTEPGFQARLEHVLQTADQNLGEPRALKALVTLVPWILRS